MSRRRVSWAAFDRLPYHLQKLTSVFVGLLYLARRWHFVVSFNGFPPGAHCFLKSAWSIRTQAWHTESWSFRVSNTCQRVAWQLTNALRLQTRVEWFCFYLEPVTCLMDVCAFIIANNVNIEKYNHLYPWVWVSQAYCRSWAYVRDYSVFRPHELSTPPSSFCPLNCVWPNSFFQ